MTQKKRLIIAMTGATGAVYGVRMLQVLQMQDEWETHLVMPSAAPALPGHPIKIF